VWKESYAPVLLNRKASLLRKETGNPSLHSKFESGLPPAAHFRCGIMRAVKMLIFSPIVLSLSIYTGLVYSYFYLLLTTLAPIFEEIYNFKSSIVGISYLGVGGGFLLGQMVFAQISDRILKRMTRKRGGEMKPEFRLPPSVVGGVLVPISFFWYGWSAQARAHWLVPIIGTGFLGFGNSLIFVSHPSSIIRLRN
jgi:hypothetical protein